MVNLEQSNQGPRVIFEQGQVLDSLGTTDGTAKGDYLFIPKSDALGHKLFRPKGLLSIADKFLLRDYNYLVWQRQIDPGKNRTGRYLEIVYEPMGESKFHLHVSKPWMQSDLVTVELVNPKDLSTKMAWVEYIGGKLESLVSGRPNVIDYSDSAAMVDLAVRNAERKKGRKLTELEDVAVFWEELERQRVLEEKGLPVLEIDVVDGKVKMFADEEARFADENPVVELEMKDVGGVLEYAEVKLRYWIDRKTGKAGFAQIRSNGREKWRVEVPLEIGLGASQALEADNCGWADLPWMREFELWMEE